MKRNPTPDEVRAWLKHHVCVPLEGLTEAELNRLDERSGEDDEQE